MSAAVAAAVPLAPVPPTLPSDEEVASALVVTSGQQAETDPSSNGVTNGDLQVEQALQQQQQQAPVWFRPEIFGEEDFNAEEYVLDMQKFVSNDTLKKELESHLASLKSELVELINRDYNEVVNLSTELVDVQETVGRMRSPLEDLRQRVCLAWNFENICCWRI